MAIVGNRPDGAVWLRPRPGLLWSGILVFIVVPIPLVATLVLLGIPDGSWPIAVIGGAISVVLFFIGLYLFKTTYLVISTTQFTERGFFSRAVTTPSSAVSSMVIAHTFGTSTSDILPQLIVRNDRGERILRMRGTFWTEETMRQAAAAIGTPLEEPVEVLTSRQFFERYTGSAYWFEDRRGLAVALVVTAGLVCVGIVLGLRVLLGLPIIS